MDPWWSDPEEQAPRMERVRRRVRERLPAALEARGCGGFRLLAWAAKSQNDNAVVYLFDPAESAIVAMWFLEDGTLDDLSGVEEDVFGVDVEACCDADGYDVVMVQVKAFRDYGVWFELAMVDDGHFVLRETEVDAPHTMAEAYVQCKKGLAIDVDYIDLYSGGGGDGGGGGAPFRRLSRS